MTDTAPSPKRLMLVASAALIDPEGRVLIAQRPEGKALAGLWEFPGGKVEPGESPEQAIIRELEEELALQVDADELHPFAFASHAYPGFHLLMPLYAVWRWRGEIEAREHSAIAWVRPNEMHKYPMPPADGPLVERLMAIGSRP